MRTFQEASALSEPQGDKPIDRFTLAYMAGLARDRIHEMVLSAFIESGLTKADLARRLDWDKSRVSKVINTSNNMTLETLGEVMFAIDGSCPAAARNWPLREHKVNLRGPEWFADCMDGVRIRTSTFQARISASTAPTTTNVVTMRKRVTEDA
jgi:hypothetical protein